MNKTIAILATLDTKGEEARFVAKELEKLGSQPLLVDLGVLGKVTEAAEIPREEVAKAGGTPLENLQNEATREHAVPVMVAGAACLLRERLDRGELHGVLGLGGLQGTAACTEVMRTFPYGLPKLMVSTVASGDTSAYVDIKDITMMFSVGDILGLNRFTRKILANAAGAVHGMAQVEAGLEIDPAGKPLIGMTNLGVLTTGAMHALELFEKAGYEVVVFHAVGSGGRAMEQMIKQGILGAVFDYAMGEIADAVHGGLRAADADRLTVAGEMGIPQVLCPGGAEHLGVLVDPPNTIPERYREHASVFHNPVVFVPRLKGDEFAAVAKEIGRRLQHTTGNACMLLPTRGTGSYAKPGGPLHDPDSDRAFFAALKAAVPSSIEWVERDTHAEDPKFVEEAVSRLVELVEKRR